LETARLEKQKAVWWINGQGIGKDSRGVARCGARPNKAQISPPQDARNHEMVLFPDFQCGASWTAVALYLSPKAELSGWA
jgi:hypothetical protein